MIPQPVETRIYAEYLLKTKPDAKIAVIYQNDDLGKGNLAGFKAALGSRASSMVVGEAAYDIMVPTVDSQIVALDASGADTLFHASNARFAAQAIRKAFRRRRPHAQILSGAPTFLCFTARYANSD